MSQTDKEWTPEYIFKFILIGNSSTGKTSMLQYFINQTCKQKRKFNKLWELNSRLNYWNTKTRRSSYKYGTLLDKRDSVQLLELILRTRLEQLQFMILQSMIQIDGISQDSFDAIDDWIKDARENGKSDLDVMVVGNKIDLKDQRVISKDHAEREMKNKDALYIETSAVTGENIDKCFQNLIDQICQKITQGIMSYYKKGRIEKDEYNPQLKNPLSQNLKTKTNEAQSQSQTCNC
uniref:Rab_B53 protein n=1 Tax=Paramecium tetraurelia TaxID=5888 RepID=Q3SDM8_PARTE|nr:rab_B53 [Paramecium tetraurelia]